MVLGKRLQQSDGSSTFQAVLGGEEWREEREAPLSRCPGQQAADVSSGPPTPSFVPSVKQSPFGGWPAAREVAQTPKFAHPGTSVAKFLSAFEQKYVEAKEPSQNDAQREAVRQRDHGPRSEPKPGRR